MAEVMRFAGPEELAQAAAGLVIDAGQSAIASGGVFRLALSGGSTPRATYEAMATTGEALGLDWGRVRVYWGDERCVPPDDPESNYRMVRLALLDRVPVPPHQVLRMACEADPQAAASAYEDLLRREFGSGGLPAFDLILLGLGNDGHTASLFPGAPTLDEHKRWVAADYVASKHHWRLTLTLDVINAAARVVFVVQGNEKASILGRVLDDASAASVYPAARVRPSEGRLVWMVDEAAARGLKGS